MATRHPERYRRMLVRHRQAREEAGLTRVQAAARREVPQTFISRTELGVRRIDPFELEELAALYETSLDFLLKV